MLEATDNQETASILSLPARYEARFDQLHRPAYHFVPPVNWMNDPNGLIYWNNQYHLFYQYNPVGPFWGTIHWGHAVSDDLVHWQDLPIALSPTLGEADTDGCWSGCAIDNDGIPTLVYTGVRGDMQLPCLATSRDGMQTWEKYKGNPVLSDLPPGLDLVAFRDPMVWREGEVWYMLIGSGIKNVGGTALLFQSFNLTDWTYLHPLTTGDISSTKSVWPGPLWECPQLIALGDKYLLTFGVWHNQPQYTVAQIGTYIDQHFTPLHEQLLDLGGDYFYAPQTLIEPTGRAIMWGWIREGRSEENQLAAGWAGVMSLPRVLSVLSDTTLGIEPAPELNSLRGRQHHFGRFQLMQQTYHRLGGVQGDCLEIVLEATLEAQSQLDLILTCLPDEKKQAIISYDYLHEWLGLHIMQSEDRIKNSLGGRFVLKRDEPLRLHIFIDRSVIEVFANGRACITGRVYPTQSDSMNIILSTINSGEITVLSMDVWELSSIWTNIFHIADQTGKAGLG